MSSTAQQLLGEGAYAKVYDNKNFALKISALENEDDLFAIVREQYILRMYLPNMVPYHSCYFKWDCMHITLEKATHNLNQWYRLQTSVSYEKIKDIACQILHGVYCLHAQEVTHRDLKPDNILLKGDAVWICDFGLSRQFSFDYSAPTGYMVTRWYRAPEIWREEAYTKKVDMWSIGCIIHKLIHGRVPGKTLKEIQQRILNLPNDSEMHTLVRGLLQLDPAKRWDAKRALAFLGEHAVEVKKEAYTPQSVLFSAERKAWFESFSTKFPKEHRVLAHALMLFDTCDQTEKNMCCAMTIAGMLFRTRTCGIVNHAIDRLTRMGYPPMHTVAGFIPEVCNGPQRLSEWETYTGTFESYIKKHLK